VVPTVTADMAIWLLAGLKVLPAPASSGVSAAVSSARDRAAFLIDVFIVQILDDYFFF
jgi:hypothetical protein